jgi:hypothetical protein
MGLYVPRLLAVLAAAFPLVCDAFGPLAGPLPSRRAGPSSAWTPRNRAPAARALRMDGQECSSTREDPQRAAGPRASEPASRPAWLKRKLLAGAAVLSVSVSAPQPSRAGDAVARDTAAAGTARRDSGVCVQLLAAVC